MDMPHSVPKTVNGKGSTRQEEHFDEFEDKSVSRNGTNGRTHKDKIVQNPKDRLLALTNAQQRVVRAVRRLPGSDSLTIGNAINLQRHQALAHSHKLTDELGVLKSDKDDPKRGGPGSRRPIHFWLADDIPAELVDALLGDLDVDPDVILANHNRRSKAKATDDEQNEDLSPLVAFAALPPLIREIANAIAQAGSRGIGAPELSQATGQRLNRIYDRVNKLVEFKLAAKQPVPGFKNQSIYTATAALLEVIEQLPLEQPEDAQANPDSNVDESSKEFSTMPPKQSSSGYSSEDASVQSPEEIDQVWDVLMVVVKRLKVLENRFGRIESALQGKERVRAAEILEMLNSDDV